MDEKNINLKEFGNTGQKVTIVGLGGEGVLRTYGRSNEAEGVIQTALNESITYFDCAHVYADSEIYYGSVWKEIPDKRKRIFQASKSASRDKQGALTDLENTLKRLQIEYLDLWQIHDVRTERDLKIISGPGGALEAFIEAKASGKVRFIGVTGHHDPNVLTKAVKEWPVDSVMMPVNPVEEILGGFLTSTLTAAREKGIAVIGMKILGGSHFLHPELNITPERLIRYALSQDITVGIVGCSSPSEVELLSSIGRDFNPITDDERIEIIEAFRPYARRLAFYRGVA